MQETPPAVQPDTRRPTNWWLWLLVLVGTMMIVLGLCVSCVSLGIVFDSSSASDGSQISFLIFFVLFGVPLVGSGLLAFWYAWRRRRKEQAQALEETVLELSREHGGGVTAADLALVSPLPLSEAQDYLEELHARGICRAQVLDDGTTWFVFSRRPPPTVASPQLPEGGQG